MWKKNFLFRAADSTPLTESENELFHDTEPALDSAGLVLDKFLSVWVQGEGTEDKPTSFTNLYVRTAMLDVRKHVSLLQPLQGRSHQIKQLLTTEQKFDAITSDPFDPWVKGAATLYTKEFFEVIRDHLNPGGVVTVFVQLYESGTLAVKSEIATFLEVFPNGMIFGNTHQGGGYDIVLLGQVGEEKIDVDRIEARLQDPRFATVAQSLAEIGFYNGVELLSTFAAQGPQLRPWLSDAQVNRDRNLRLQYLAGLGVNKYEQAQIYSEILQYRQVPPNLFVGTPDRLAALSSAIMNRY